MFSTSSVAKIIEPRVVTQTWVSWGLQTHKITKELDTTLLLRRDFLRCSVTLVLSSHKGNMIHDFMSWIANPEKHFVDQW